MHISHTFLKNHPPVREASGRRSDRWFQAVDSKSDRVSLKMDIDETAKGKPFFSKTLRFIALGLHLWLSQNFIRFLTLPEIPVLKGEEKHGKPIVVILMGAPGSGKSTFCEHVMRSSTRPWVRVCQVFLCVFRLQCVRRNASVCFENYYFQDLMR